MVLRLPARYAAALTFTTAKVVDLILAVADGRLGEVEKIGRISLNGWSGFDCPWHKISEAGT
jgi:hypothetical protein